MISKYKLHCLEHGWVWIDADLVDIKIDLQFKQRVFQAICPECGDTIINTVEDMTLG